VPQRTTVTVLFSDLVGSTALLNQIGEAANDELRRDVFSVLRRAVDALGGQVVKTQGDGMMVAFQGRVTDAVACAVAWQQGIDVLARRDPSLRLAIRVGVSTGEATSEDDDWFGTPVVEAARLCAVAGTSKILVSEAVRLVADDAGIEFVPVGKLELKGFPEARAAYEVPWEPVARAPIVPRPPALDTTGAPPFANRVTERRRITDAVATDARRTVFVAGPAGIGKTRLIADALRDAQDATVLAGSCAGAGRYCGSAEALRWYVVAAPIDELRRVLGPDAAILAAEVPAITVRLPDVAASTDATVDELLEAYVAAFGRLAAAAPLVLLLDDLHVASGPQLAVLLELATRTGVTGLTLLGAFRTDDLGATPPALAMVLEKLERVSDVDRIDVGPLTAADLAVLAGDDTVDTLAVYDRTGGNPAQVVDALRRLAVHDDTEEALALAFPFKGLISFRAEDASLFFGRDDAIGALLGRLASERFVAVVGTSGSGKSSLIRAGLLPALDAGALPGEWPSVACTPGTHPEKTLTTALAAGIPRVVFVDQLEECVTLGSSEEERSQFLDRLAQLATRRGEDTCVVVTIRADLLGMVAAASPAFAALVETGSFFLGSMTGEELRAAVEGPAAVTGLKLEPGFVDIVVSDVHGEPGALPLLSHALLETWKRRRGNTLTIANYREAGGARGAIARSADVLFESLDARGQALTRALFLQLTELGEGTEDSRRRLDVSEVAALGDDNEMARLLDALVGARLVTVDEGTVEVAHEALIREWPRLREWLDEGRDELRLQREVARRADDWDRLGRPDAELLRGARLEQALETGPVAPLEQEYLAAGSSLRDREAAENTRRVRRLRMLLAAALVLLIVAVGAGVVARNNAEDARDQNRLADVQRVSAESIATSDTNLAVAFPLAVEGFRLENRYESRNALLSVVQSEPALLGYLAAPTGGYNAGAIAPDGKRAALAGAKAIDVWDLNARTRGATLPVKQAAALTMLADGRVAVATPARIEIWSLHGSKPDRVIPQRAVSLASSGKQLLAGGPGGAVLLIEPSTGRVVARQRQGTEPVHVAAVKDVVVTAGAVAEPSFNPPFRTTLVKRDAATLAEQRQLDDSIGGVPTDVAVSPSGASVAVANTAAAPTFKSADGSTRDWVGQGAATFVPGESAQVAFVDDTTAVAAGTTGRVATFSLIAERSLPAVVTQFGTARDLLVTPDRASMWAIGAGAVGWSLRGVDSLGGAPAGGAQSFPAGVSPDGRLLLVNTDVTSGLDEVPPPPADPGAPQVGSALSVSRTTHVLDTRTMKPVGDSADGLGIGFLADSERFLMEDLAQVQQPVATITRVNARTGAREPLAVPPHQGNPVLSADGTRLALIALDGRVTVIDPANGATVASQLGLQGKGVPDVVAFGPGGAVAVQYPDAHRIVIVDGGKTQEIDTGANSAGAIAFSPNRQRIAAGGIDGNVRLYSRATGKVEGSWLVGHTGRVLAVEYDRSGALLASTGGDGTTRLFDVEQRRPYGRPFPSIGTARRLFDRDGTKLFNATPQGIVTYSLDPKVWEQRACALVGANMTKLAWSLYLPDRTPSATCKQYPPPQ
jgi:class 3 adenylate cyclase/WD40 repeat protein